MTARGLAVWLVCLGLTVVSGVQVTLSSQQIRDLYAALEQVQSLQDEQLAEHSRLLLERSALAAYHNVERIAEARLDMAFPDHVEQLDP